MEDPANTQVDPGAAPNMPGAEPVETPILTTEDTVSSIKPSDETLSSTPNIPKMPDLDNPVPAEDEEPEVEIHVAEEDKINLTDAQRAEFEALVSDNPPVSSVPHAPNE